MKVELGEPISNEQIKAFSFVNDTAFLMQVCKKTGFGTTTVRNLMKGKAVVNSGNKVVLLTAAKLADKQYDKDIAERQELQKTLRA